MNIAVIMISIFALTGVCAFVSEARISRWFITIPLLFLLLGIGATVKHHHSPSKEIPLTVTQISSPDGTKIFTVGIDANGNTMLLNFSVNDGDKVVKNILPGRWIYGIYCCAASGSTTKFKVIKAKNISSIDDWK